MATEYYFADQKQGALHLGNRAFLFFLHLLLFVFPLASALNGSSLDQADSQALQVLKLELQDFKGVLAGWNGSDPSEACSGNHGWVGIKCLQGRVVSIQLPWKGLGGKITEKIGELKALRRISLHDNALEGSIPLSLGSLPKLRGVYLFNNRLSGSIPASIANCAHLQSLDLSNNSLSGPVLPVLASSPMIRRLNLSFNSLSGSIPVSFTQSSSLVLLSLQHNNLSGAIPNRWASGGDKGPYLLQRLTLDHNGISGAVPDSLGQLGNLKELDLSSNRLTGTIPATIGNISGITLLDLSGNSLDGEIPQALAALFNLTVFNVSHNNLSGSVPFPLGRRFNSSSFFGNLRLCGYSISVPCPRNLPAQSAEAGKHRQHRRHRRHWLNTKDFILILAGAVLVVLLLVCCILLCCFLRKRAASRSAAAAGGEKAVPEATTEYGSGGEGKLVHFDGPSVFTADDLLCATAEVIGKSNYGTTYKATLEDGREVAVKRLREKMTKSQKEFEAEVAALGSIRHENLLPLRAFYVGPKGEKLLVFDYLHKGSLASNLHDRGTEIPIAWPTRKSIAVGICRGLNHLHIQHNQVHGSLTSGGVLLDGHNRPKISDFGLPRLMASAAAATGGSLGYRPPELSKAKKATPKTDVFSLGVIMLELLTGKSAGEATNGMDLPEWVASVVKEEWTNEVFDLEIMKDGAAEGDELLNALKLALHCVDPSPSARPEIQQILQQLEEMSHADSADDDEARQREIIE